MGNDPLTSIEAMIAMIEPGPRMIDGSLLKELYLAAGQPALAASIDPGFRLVNATLLHDLAIQVGAQLAVPIFGEPFQDPGPRLIEGVAWKELADQAGAPAGPRITSPTAVSGMIGEPFSYQITATIPSGGSPITSFGAIDLPVWASINTTTGEITGTPVAPHGLFNVTLQATSAEGTGTRVLRMTIAARPLIVWAGYFGPAPTSMQPGQPGRPDNMVAFEALPNTIARPAIGTVMVAPAPVGSWGPCFAYPATLPPPTSIIDSVAGNVTASFSNMIVSISPPHPADPPQDYRVYFLASFLALPVAGTTSTLTI